MIYINIAKDFSEIPDARYRTDGDFSGQQFREDFLEKYFVDDKNEEIIEINLDGTAGYATSFLEEAFGGLARKFGIDKVKARLKFVSEEDSSLTEEIDEYIRDCNLKKKK